MSEEDRWVVLGSFSTTLEAEMVKQTLEADEIPVLIRGSYAGVFGGAYQGPVPGGIELMVPESELERARTLVEPSTD